MFPALLAKLIQQVDTVRRSIETSDAIRKLLSRSTGDGELESIKDQSPTTTEWRIYDHCAALTRLYAIYESFVDEIVSDLLTTLPSLFKYSDLKEGVQKEHRDGVAHILQRLGNRRYSSLSLEEIVKDYYEAISGTASDYRIPPWTMLRSDQNLRMNILDLVFSRIGIGEMPSWLSGHRFTEIFIENVRGGQNTIEAELTSFIDYRNDAAHGKPVNVLGKESLLEYCAFIDAVCQALYERVNHWIVSRRLETGTANSIGEITEEYSRNVSVARIHGATLEKGDDLLFMGDRYCYRAAIENIQVDDVDVQRVAVIDDQEIGFKTSVPAKLGASVVTLESA